MADPIPEPFDVFSETAKALAEVMLGESRTDFLRQLSCDFSALEAENRRLMAEAASLGQDLQESLQFREKYENLKREFQKVAAERDDLRAKDLDATRVQQNYGKLKEAYQSKSEQLAALKKSVEDLKSSTNAYSSFENLYQAFKESCERSGADIRRIPVQIGLQFLLQDGSGRGTSFTFLRKSKTNWKRIG